MRFKARLINQNMGYLSTCVTTNRQIDTSAAIFLDEEYLRMSLINHMIDNKPQVFTEIHRSSIFEEYRIESKSNNRILFEIDLSLFEAALKSGRNAPSVDLKLVKRGTMACLCVEASFIGNVIQHDIPVKVLRADTIHLMTPPQIHDPVVALELPRGKTFKLSENVRRVIGSSSSRRTH